MQMSDEDSDRGIEDIEDRLNARIAKIRCRLNRIEKNHKYLEEYFERRLEVRYEILEERISELSIELRGCVDE